MKSFNYHQSTEILFGCGRIKELADQSMVLPDYKANPRVATREEMIHLVRDSYESIVKHVNNKSY